MKTHITNIPKRFNYYENAQLYFAQKFQGGFLDPDTAVLIEKAIDKLLKRDNIFRNENIPKDGETISEEEYVKKHQEDDNFYKPENTEKEEDIQNDDNLDYDELQQRND
ncbi:hypothetical protein [Flavobacterium pectinovorum]|uniref:hypothetical protein n=1 Tax=Flavobacterium pectinovorum TaxID=29533 RepID=UPI001FAC70B9|nr:hypothetical protein [Flavobacterium pectinovorum]MCI9844839.1 hypothetical protein [Flavobacterium pectinovorum]